MDLKEEDLNRALKDFVTSLGPNVTYQSILQCGKSLNMLLKVMSLFDRQHDLHPESLEHKKPLLAKGIKN